MKKNAWEPYLYLVLGFITLLLSNGKWTIALMAWIAPVLLIRFTRSVKWPIALGGALAATGIASYLGFMGTMATAEFHIVAAIAGGSLFLALCIDKLFASKDYISTLMFPLAWTALECTSLYFNPFGTWGSIAYSQNGVLSVMQILSVLGISGITFMIGWFASSTNWAWEHKFNCKKIWKGAAITGTILFLIIGLGAARVMLLEPVGPTTKVAGVTEPARDLAAIAENIIQTNYIGKGVTVTDEIRDNVNEAVVNAIHKALRSTSRREVRTEAELIIWPEGQAFMPARSVPSFINITTNWFASLDTHVVTSMLILEDGGRVRSQVMMLGPEGQAVYNRVKSIATPGVDAGKIYLGDKTIYTQPTREGVIAVAMSYEADFPNIMRTAAGAGIVALPSTDPWEDSRHSQAAAFRAVENGYSIFRASSRGDSYAYDYLGRELGHWNPRTSDSVTWNAELPAQGVKTLYSTYGDWFSWLTLFAFVGLALTLKGKEIKKLKKLKID
jgi:apolipoprotein N-acyltransferase